jgi:hypothetical protein
MEVDVSYTENLDASKIALLLASGRLEYIPTAAPASPVGCAGGGPPPKPHELGVHPLAGMAANDAAAERRLGRHSPGVGVESYSE